MDRRWRVSLLWTAAAVVVFVVVASVATVRIIRSRADSYAPRIEPGQFTTMIDNPYFPLRPGNRWVYEGPGADGKPEQTVIDVTSETRRVGGVMCVVVRDTETANGQVIEDAVNWYAQDAEGNVWNFGEETKEFADGKLVDTEGSWETGVKGAKPGIAMQANPKIGDHYRKEYLRGEAEATADVLSLNEHATVPFGSFDGVRMTKEYSPLESSLVDHRYYAKDVGLVLVVMVKGGSGRTQLIEMTHR
jgi:hypothetical protein